jgi:hypothetical protein
MSESIRTSNLFSAEDYKKVFKAYSFINYTAYDFDTLKQALINYIQTYYPEDFNDYVESSEFIAIIELLAYFGTSLAFRTDLNSRENFIDTAERRESIIRLAQMVNYVPKRNLTSNGLFKITAVETNQPLVDANGVNINDTTIFWNDPNNPDWFDQFIQICNAGFNPINPFGRPTKSGTIGSIPTDLYQLNNILRLNVTYPTAISVSGQQYNIDICNPDFVNNQTIFERDPDPNESFNFIYRNDSLGFSSANTGFFLYFKQGNLINVDTNFEFPVPNRIFPIDIVNINQTDVFVQETDQDGNVINKWVKVPALAGENIIYNSLQYSIRNIFDVISGANNTVSVRFADGNFGNIPTGLFRFWVRVSANENLVIRPENAQSLQITIPYIGYDQQQYNLTVTFSLEQTIANASAAETNDQIRLRAPEVFSTQSRMVNGSDYNVLPLVYGNQIAKLQAIERTYSGQSRYIDVNDPTGFHRDLIIFGQDGSLYRDNQNAMAEVIKDQSNEANIDLIVLNTISEIVQNKYISNFFFDEYLPQFEQKIRVNPSPAKPDGYSLLDIGIVPGDTTNSLRRLPLIWRTSPVKFKNDTGYFVNYQNVSAVSISTVSFLGSLVTVGTAQPHNLVTGRVLTFSGFAPAIYNGTFNITVLSPTTFRYTVPGTPSGSPSVVGVYIVNNDPAALLNNFSTEIISNGVYQNWGFIKAGSLLQFTDISDTLTLNTTSVVSVYQDGLPLVVNPLNPYANIGPVELGTEQQLNYYATKVYPPFRTEFTDTEKENILLAINNGISFWLYYDLINDVWGTSTAASASAIPVADQPFEYPPLEFNSSTGNYEIYSNWANYPTSGLIYVDLVSNDELETTTFSIEARGRVYVFESYRDVRFYWEPNQVVIDSTTGQAKQDTIEIMPFVNTNSTIDNNEPVVVDPIASFLKLPSLFTLSGVFVQPDGYTDTSKIEVSLVDVNQDGSIDDPRGFEKIVSVDDRVVFEYYSNEISGYQTTRPWICNWGVDLKNWINDLYVYFPVDRTSPNPAEWTDLYIPPYIANVQFDPATQQNYITDPESYKAVNPAFRYVSMSEADLIFINQILQLEFNGITPVKSIANQLTAFFNGPTTTNITNYPWLAGTENVINKSEILSNYFLNKSFLIYSISPPGYGVYQSLTTENTSDLISYPFGKVVISQIDSAHYDRNGKTFTQNTSVKEINRLPLYFKWSHYSPIDQRVDPAPTNIIDMIVITNNYYRDMLIWKNSNGSIISVPTPPTTEELRVQFQDLNQYKMLSDSMIWNSGRFKLLFGPQAENELQATFKVVKAPTTNISDNEVKTRVIQAIDTYFDIRNWDFGEKFFYTELAAFIHQQLARIISSVVIVPNSANSQFGNLFEIVATPNELFMSTATVNNVQIVANYTNQNLRV